MAARDLARGLRNLERRLAAALVKAGTYAMSVPESIAYLNGDDTQAQAALDRAIQEGYSAAIIVPCELPLEAWEAAARAHGMRQR